MNYVAVIHKEDDSCYGVTIPDLEGCISAGDTMDEAIRNAQDAISFHLEGLAEDGIYAPMATPIEILRKNPDYDEASVSWAFIDMDVSAFLGKTEKATVTLPKSLIKKIDLIVASGKAKSRSSFLADAAVQAIAPNNMTHRI